MSTRSTPVTLSAVVLAGGQSSRMGQDKALVSIGKQTLLQHVCSVARQCASSVYVVTPWVDRYQDLLSQGAEFPVHFVEEQVLSEQDARHGPLVGFAQGLSQVQTEWVLLLACDLPRLQAEVLQFWSALLLDADKDTIALLPKNPQGWWEPLCGFYRCCCLNSLNHFIEEGGRSFQRWLSSQPVRELPLSDPQMLLNCNTPEDIEAFFRKSSNRRKNRD